MELCGNRNTLELCVSRNILELCSNWNILAMCSDRNTEPNVPTGTLSQFMSRTPNKNRQYVPAGTLDEFCTAIVIFDVHSSLHSKCNSNYSANSSGSSTTYGTCHRCCQSEGRRGQDYDCHQSGRILRGC